MPATGDNAIYIPQQPDVSGNDGNMDEADPDDHDDDDDDNNDDDNGDGDRNGAMMKAVMTT